MQSIYDFSYQQIEDMVVEHGWKKYRGKQLYQWLYRKRVNSFYDMSDLNKEMQETLASEYSIGPLKVIAKQVSKDKTRKYLFELADGAKVESVLMYYNYGRSVCVTSQVGCNMGCSFCASGLLKKQRDLTSGEMVQQVLSIQEDLDEVEERVSHVVVMGTGEPFDNYDNVLNFAHTINSDYGLAIGARHITVSTCGLVDGIRKYALEKQQYNLAISLHAPNNELRSKLMKINNAYPLEELMAALREYSAIKNRRLGFEYILLKNVNDTDECAIQLANLCKGFDVFVNLIPYNQVDENGYKTVDIGNAMRFYDKLMKMGVQCTLRQEHGSDIDAACGQLRAKYERSN